MSLLTHSPIILLVYLFETNYLPTEHAFQLRPHLLLPFFGNADLHRRTIKVEPQEIEFGLWFGQVRLVTANKMPAGLTQSGKNPTEIRLLLFAYKAPVVYI